MKISSPFLVFAVLIIGLGLKAETMSSNIVGFVHLSATGTGGSGASQLTFHSLTLRQVPVYAGTATSFTYNTLTDPSATWANGTFVGTHYVEIVSSNGNSAVAGVGSVNSIIANVAATGVITVEGTLNASLTAPLTYRVRKHWTLAEVFGAANSAGLQGGTPTTADQIILWNGPDFATYYYQTSGIGGSGWRRLGAQSTDASGTIIRPNSGLLIRRGQSSTKEILLTGEVKSGQNTMTFTTGYSYVGNPFAVAMTLGSSGLYSGNVGTGLLGGTSASTADQVLIWSGAHYTTYYYDTAVNGWRSATDSATDAASVSIGAGTGFILRRRDGSSFTWTAPQHPASF